MAWLQQKLVPTSSKILLSDISKYNLLIWKDKARKIHLLSTIPSSPVSSGFLLSSLADFLSNASSHPTGWLPSVHSSHSNNLPHATAPLLWFQSFHSGISDYWHSRGVRMACNCTHHESRKTTVVYLKRLLFVITLYAFLRLLWPATKHSPVPPPEYSRYQESDDIEGCYAYDCSNIHEFFISKVSSNAKKSGNKGNESSSNSHIYQSCCWQG